MKTLNVAIVLLVVSYSSYADKWDDFYNNRLNGIRAAILVAPNVGAWAAYANGQLCEGYIDGFLDGTTANNIFSEYESQRYLKWRIKVKSMGELAYDHMSKIDWESAAHSTLRYFEHNCKYRTILLRETDAKRKQ